MACPYSRVENFLYSGLVLWRRGTPRTGGHVSPPTNQPTVAYALPHLMEKLPRVPTGACSPLRCTRGAPVLGRGGWRLRMHRNDGHSIDFSDTSHPSHSPLFLSSFNFCFPPDLSPFHFPPFLLTSSLFIISPVSLHSYLSAGFPSHQPHLCLFLKLQSRSHHLGLPICHLVSRVLSLSLSPPTECWPLAAWFRSFMCFRSHHTQSGN